MNGYRIGFAIVAILSVVLSASAVRVVLRSPEFRRKGLWVAGSLAGFVGLAIDLSSPHDLYVTIGAQIPVLSVVKVHGGPWIARTMFPFIAVVALIRAGEL